MSANASDSPDSRVSALFQTMVAQQVNMALMCLGQAPGEDGQKTVDLDAARFFIDVLEMLEAKTKGNLSPHEQTMLTQSLASLRMAFVEIANAKSGSAARPAPSAPSAPAAEQPAPSAVPPSPGPSASPDDSESRKKFTKKY